MTIDMTFDFSGYTYVNSKLNDSHIYLLPAMLRPTCSAA